MRKVLSLVVAVLLALLAVVPAFAQESQTIPELLANDADGRFTTLLAALDAANLTDTLSGEGPFTLLAPTNDAFAAALDYLGVSADDLLADTETLTTVLLYHVIPGQNFFRSLTSGPTLDTALDGEAVTFLLDAGVLTAEGVEIYDVDNIASNGIVQVAEGVLLPPSLREAAQTNRAHVRVAHLSPDAGPVDIYLNGTLTDLQSVEFGTVSEWTETAAQAYRVGVAVAGGDPVKNTLGRIDAGEWVTVAVIGTRSNRAWEIVFLREDYSPIADNVARVSFFHSLQGFGAVDILANSSLLIANLGFPGFYGSNDGFDTRDVSAGTYTFQVVGTGTTAPAALERTLSVQPGHNYFISASGVVSSPTLIVADTDTTPATEVAPAQ